jgi:DNA-binding transcriptional ArsR family regulator
MGHHSLDESLRLLADHNRRAIIRELRRSSEEVRTFEELINRLHDDGQDTERAALAIKLRHTHLPKLAEAGLLEYDRRSGAVRYDPDERVETLLDALPDSLSKLDETIAES